MAELVFLMSLGYIRSLAFGGSVITDQLESIKSRKSFYYRNYRGACSILWGALLLILLLSVALFYLYITNPPPDFYATSMDGSLVHLAPVKVQNNLNQPPQNNN